MNTARKKNRGRGGAREGAGRPLKPRIKTTASQEGLSGTWTRATFIIKKEHVRKLKSLALSRGERLKDILDEILADALPKKASTFKPNRSIRFTSKYKFDRGK